MVSMPQTTESLRKEFERLKKENERLHQENQTFRVQEVQLEKMFTKGQLDRLKWPDQASELDWQTDDIQNAAQLYNYSPEAYTYLLEERQFPLPTPSTLGSYEYQQQADGYLEEEPAYFEMVEEEGEEGDDDSDPLLLMKEDFDTQEIKSEHEQLLQFNC